MKKIITLLLILTTFVVNSQTLINLTATKQYDANGGTLSSTTATIYVSVGNLASVTSSGSGSLVYLQTPIKTQNGIVASYSVTSTPAQVNTAVSATVSAFALSAGSVAAPTGAWSSNAASGWYEIGSNNYGFSVNGTKVYEIAAAGNSLSGLTTMTNATAAAGTITALSTASITSTGIVKFGGTPQTLTGAGAVNITTYSTLLVTTANPDAFTLADGAEGQLKLIKMKTDGGDGTLTPTNLAGGSTITFNDAGDSCLLQFLDGEWCIIGNSGCTVG